MEFGFKKKLFQYEMKKALLFYFLLLFEILLPSKVRKFKKRLMGISNEKSPKWDLLQHLKAQNKNFLQEVETKAKQKL